MKVVIATTGRHEGLIGIFTDIPTATKYLVEECKLKQAGPQSFEFTTEFVDWAGERNIEFYSTDMMSPVGTEDAELGMGDPNADWSVELTEWDISNQIICGYDDD